ncbi:MAG: endonuclease MutS2 [Candidatus Bipolaricaulota bacterium]|nr:endonuclease MutS2 [Candidatus Bipolaricaulota bacterium]MBS3791452.1 endonuclease MutS2 [Candidatus Bipolaricaulota bacterium]
MTESVTNERTYRDLEFEKLKNIVKDFSVSSLGSKRIEELAPSSDRQEIEQQLSKVEECRGLLEKPEPFKLGEISEFKPLIKQAEEHPPLEATDFLEINGTLEVGQETRQYILDQPADETTYLAELAENIHPLEDLQTEIKSKIDRRGEIRDTATARLFNLLKEKREIESEIKENLEGFLENHKNLIQDRVVVQKSNRLVVPLISSAKERVDCVIHGSSNSGRTLFAEPSSAVKLNNKLKDLTSEILEEKKRIRRELTELFKKHKWELNQNQKILGELDSIYARARFSQRRSCSSPKLTDDDGIALIDARHPLLDQDEVVPITIKFGRTEKGATITGPNTGGKTVTLKTIGLFTLMVQSGIPIPAHQDSRVEIYHHVFSDIGDEQSIEQSLSTFSSHMGNIVGIFEEMDSESLVLLDELGAGTDPEEGAALGLAILETLLEAETRFAVTTHFTAIKNFSFNHPQLATFSVDFDPEELVPTYHILEGVPGKSNAFIIASRLGLGDEIISKAEEFLDEGKIQAENIIKDLVKEKRKIRKKGKEIDEKLTKAKKVKQKYDEKLDKLQSDQKNALRSELRTLDKFIEKAKREIEKAISSARNSDEEGAREALKNVKELEEKIEKGKEALSKEETQPSLKLEELKPGQPVSVKSTGGTGEIVRVKSKEEIEISVNGMKLTTELSDLRRPPEKARKPGNKSESKVNYSKSSGPAGFEINVRGMTVREAIREVDKYVDRLIRSERSKGRILHGKGSGTLRRNIRDHLRSSNLIKKCYGPPPSEGGEGVTVFEL